MLSARWIDLGEHTHSFCRAPQSRERADETPRRRRCASGEKFTQTLKIKTFVGTSPTAGKTQVWTALITTLMLRLKQWTWLETPFAVPPDPPGPEQVVMAF
jgi:hypothetical protein